MIVEDQLDRCVGRIGGVEKLEEFDEFAPVFVATMRPKMLLRLGRTGERLRASA
jgi:hypothetical protein